MIIMSYTPTMLVYTVENMLKQHRKKEIASNETSLHEPILIGNIGNYTHSSCLSGFYTIAKKNGLSVGRSIKIECQENGIPADIHVLHPNNDVVRFVKERHEDYNEYYILSLMEYLDSIDLTINPKYLQERTTIPIWATPLAEIINECYLEHRDNARWCDKNIIKQTLDEWVINNPKPRQNIQHIIQGLYTIDKNCNPSIEIRSTTPTKVVDSIISEVVPMMNWKHIFTDVVRKWESSYNVVKSTFVDAYCY